MGKETTLSRQAEDKLIEQAIDLLEKRMRTVKTGEISLPDEARRYLRLQLEEEEREIFAVLFLDNRHRLLSYDELFFGTVNECSVYPREVVKRALNINSSAVILAHNHPSGIPEPSKSDLVITEKIKKSLALIDIRVLDHFIVGKKKMVSFAERGLI